MATKPTSKPVYRHPSTGRFISAQEAQAQNGYHQHLVNRGHVAANSSHNKPAIVVKPKKR